MKFLTITGGDKTPLTPHFNASEFYSHSSDRPAQHPFADVLVQAAEVLRTHFGTAWRITSTFRTEADERRILKAKNKPFFVSQHMKGKAFDSQPANMDPAIMHAIWVDFTTNGPLYKQLRALGINGFGIYNTFIHLDCRSDEFKAHRADTYGPVARWDSRTGAAREVGNSWGVASVTNPASTTTNPLPSPSPAPTLRKLPESPWIQRLQASSDSCSH